MLRWWWWSEKNDDDDTIHFLDCSCHSFASSSWFSLLPWLFFALCNRCIEREKGSSKRVINLRSIIVIDFLDSLSAPSLGVCDTSASFFLSSGCRPSFLSITTAFFVVRIKSLVYFGLLFWIPSLSHSFESTSFFVFSIFQLNIEIQRDRQQR